MQVEVSFERMMGIMAEKLGRAEIDNARLIATNEVLTERLQEHERTNLQRQAPERVDDQSSAG